MVPERERESDGYGARERERVTLMVPERERESDGYGARERE
jgi:hypothetical protein